LETGRGSIPFPGVGWGEHRIKRGPRSRKNKEGHRQTWDSRVRKADVGVLNRTRTPTGGMTKGVKSGQLTQRIESGEEVKYLGGKIIILLEKDLLNFYSVCEKTSLNVVNSSWEQASHRKSRLRIFWGFRTHSPVWRFRFFAPLLVEGLCNHLWASAEGSIPSPSREVTVLSAARLQDGGAWSLLVMLHSRRLNRQAAASLNECRKIFR